MQAAGQQGIPDGFANLTCAAPGDQLMKKLLVLGLVAVMASGALAQFIEHGSEENMMGVFFDAEVFTSETTNFMAAGLPFNAYIVMLNATVPSIGAYEAGLMLSEPVFILGVTGPNGWTNFGNNTNHLAGYMTPLPASADGGVVLSTLNMLYTGVAAVEISMGPSSPSSFNSEGPGIANGEDVDETHLCPLTTYMEEGQVWGVVATINGTGVVATEAHSLSSVKALFN
jgi:hypothetical protein